MRTVCRRLTLASDDLPGGVGALRMAAGLVALTKSFS
jgi:hypothetical protein